MMKKNKRLFITFEGIEGSGKSTQIKYASAYLKKKGYTVCVVREPGDTRVGEKIRAILLDKKNTALSPLGELLLYNAARCQLIHEIIQPALTKGVIVLCDRFSDSTVAYQHFGGGLDRTVTRTVIDCATGGLKPDITFLLDTPVTVGLKRSGRGDRMELKSLAFHRRVHKGFITLAKEDPKRFYVLPRNASIDDVRQMIERKLDACIRYYIR